MSLHLTAIGRKVAPGSHAALVLDGAGYHIAAALTIPENITLVRLPPYAPELNPIENVWEYLRATNSRSPSSTTTTTSLIKPATHGTSLSKIQSASRQSPPEHGQQSIFRAVGDAQRGRVPRRRWRLPCCRRADHRLHTRAATPLRNVPGRGNLDGLKAGRA
ncbi:transposase [Bradyrhizobium sp.]|uniref:transposase n=1 Tax=Bradyrhizobium sp. TaxID=376 RepID=UPI003BAF7223